MLKDKDLTLVPSHDLQLPEPTNTQKWRQNQDVVLSETL